MVLEIACPIVRGENIRHTWEKSVAGYLNGIPVEKAFHWEHLLSDDTIIIHSALSSCKILKDESNKRQKILFMEKLATVIPNSHSRNLLLQFYLQLCNIFQDESDLLVTLVKFYPVAVTPTNIFLRKHFIDYLNEHPNKGENESEIIVWGKTYLLHVFELKDVSTAISTLDWLSQFRYRAVHEFLLTTASNQIPKLSKPEYWLFLYRLLEIVVPGPPPTLISSNRYASVLFSVAAAVSPGCPFSPEHFLLMGHRLTNTNKTKVYDYDMDLKPILYTNISLTPGLVGLAAYIMTKFPTPSVLPFIKNVVNIKQGANIHLFGCFIYPLAILGGINDNHIKDQVTEIMAQILNMGPCPLDQKDYISQDDYSEKCIKTQSTLISLKLGQVLSHIAEKGVDLVGKQLKNSSKLTTFSATVLCHSIVVCEDRPPDILLSAFNLADDVTNMPILTFLIIHINLIIQGRVKQSRKFSHLYMRRLPLLMKNASSSTLKRMVKMMLSDAGPFNADDVLLKSALYQIMLEIWEEHGGLVYDTFYSMLSNPKHQGLDLVIMTIIRRMCNHERPVDSDDMKRIVLKYLDVSSDELVIGNCIDSLTFLCLGGLEFRQVHHIIRRFVDNKKLALPVCYFYSEYLLECQSTEQIEQVVSILWGFSRSTDSETSAMAYKGLLNSEIEFVLTEEIEKNIISLLKQAHHPQYSAEFVASMISRELKANPAQVVGVIPNPPKKLLSDFKVKDFFAAKNLTHALFSFSNVSPTANRQQHKKQLHLNERILSSFLSKCNEDDFNDAFDGIIIIEGWNHFMCEYIKSIFNMPTYQRRNRTDGNSPAALLESIKLEVTKVVERELQNNRSMYLRVLIITSIANAVYKIALQNDVFNDHIKQILAKDIGLLRTLIVFNNESSNSSLKTDAILRLCSAYMAKIAGDMEDEDLLGMLLVASTESLPSTSSLSDLVSQCAAIATGAIVHVFYKLSPTSTRIKDAIQRLLDSKHYLGLCFCVDSFCNSIPRSITRKFIDDVVSETVRDYDVAADRILFMGLLIVYSFHIDNAEVREIIDLLSYIGNRIDASLNEMDQKYNLMILGLIHYGTSNWQHCLSSWKTAYQDTVKSYTAKFADKYAAIPTLALLTGFPISNLVDYFDWGPLVDGVVTYSEFVTKSLQYEDGRLCSLIIARKFEESKNTLVNYRALPNSTWAIVNDLIESSLQKHCQENKRNLNFALEILCNVSVKIPLSNPLQMIVGIFTMTSLQEKVMHFAGVHAKHSSFHYYDFIEKFLSLSVFPQLSLACQNQIVAQLPNFVHYVEKRKLKHLLSKFLSETFWQGSKELRLEILNTYQVLLKEHPTINEHLCDALIENYFKHPNLHLLTPAIIEQVGLLMKSVDFYKLELNHLVAESQLVVDFIRTDHHAKDVVERYFTRYLQAELYTTELLRAVVRIVLALDKDIAYSNLFSVMCRIKKSLEEHPDNFMNPAIACINTVVLTYIAYLKDEKSIGSGLEHFVYLSEIVEPQVNVDCLAVVLKSLDPWSKINRLYIDVLPNDC
ncbi:hypothetical protein ACHWQZ_G004124 [Mnemiopsis leidyi]